MLLLPVSQLSNVLSTEQLFYTCIIPFIIFFGSFAFVLYPLRDVLHPTGVADSSTDCIGSK
jgi:AAA family ATP:ADP antiporter